MAAISSGALVEMFGSGTAAVVSPVGGLHYEGRMNAVPTPADGLAVKILAAMTDIYYGRVKHPWAIDIEEWDIDKSQVTGLERQGAIHSFFCFHHHMGPRLKSTSMRGFLHLLGPLKCPYKTSTSYAHHVP